MNTIVVHPPEGGPLPVVLFYDLGRRGVPRAIPLYRVDPLRQHGHRQTRLATSDGAKDSLRKLFRLRRNRQVGSAGRHPEASGCAAGSGHAAPPRVVSRRRARLRISVARRHLQPRRRGTRLGAAVQSVRADAVQGRLSREFDPQPRVLPFSPERVTWATNLVMKSPKALASSPACR
jgi:hypothetical protein